MYIFLRILKKSAIKSMMMRITVRRSSVLCAQLHTIVCIVLCAVVCAVVGVVVCAVVGVVVCALLWSVHTNICLPTKPELADKPQCFFD